MHPLWTQYLIICAVLVTLIISNVSVYLILTFPQNIRYKRLYKKYHTISDDGLDLLKWAQKNLSYNITRYLFASRSNDYVFAYIVRKIEKKEYVGVLVHSLSEQKYTYYPHHTEFTKHCNVILSIRERLLLATAFQRELTQ